MDERCSSHVSFLFPSLDDTIDERGQTLTQSKGKELLVRKKSILLHYWYYYSHLNLCSGGKSYVLMMVKSIAREITLPSYIDLFSY